MSDDKTRIRGSAADGPAEAGGRMIPLRLLAWLPWIAAGGFALLAGFLSQAYFAARSEILALREQGALAAIVGKGLQPGCRIPAVSANSRSSPWFPRRVLPRRPWPLCCGIRSDRRASSSWPT